MRHLHLKPEARRRLYSLPPKHRDALLELLHGLADSQQVGHPLSNDLEGAYKIVRGPFRVVVKPRGDALVVLRVQHRSKVYRPR